MLPSHIVDEIVYALKYAPRDGETLPLVNLLQTIQACDQRQRETLGLCGACDRPALRAILAVRPCGPGAVPLKKDDAA